MEEFYSINIPSELLAPTVSRSVLVTWLWLSILNPEGGGSLAPSSSHLAGLIGADERTARRAVLSLQSMGLLTAETRYKLPAKIKLKPRLTDISVCDRHQCPLNDCSPETGVEVGPIGSQCLPETPQSASEGSGGISMSGRLESSLCKQEEEFLVLEELEQKQERLKKERLIFGYKDESILPARVVRLYNDIFATAKGRNQAKRVSPGTQRYISLKARTVVYRTEEEWVEIFTRASKSPGLLGQTESWPQGATLTSFCKASFIEKVLEGSYDEWNDTVDISQTFREKDRLADIMGDMRLQARMFLQERIEARDYKAKEWWADWVKTIEMELKASDAIRLLEQVKEYARNQWRMMIKELKR